MTGSIRIFEKITFHPKITLFVLLKVNLANMTDWHSENYEELCLDAGQSFFSLAFFSVDMYFRANVT